MTIIAGIFDVTLTGFAGAWGLLFAGVILPIVSALLFSSPGQKAANHCKD